jgi:hypothetical protein
VLAAGQLAEQHTKETGGRREAPGSPALTNSCAICNLKPDASA